MSCLYQNHLIFKAAVTIILTSPNLSQNRVPAIRIASAVVTNRGGRTCHAGELIEIWHVVVLIVLVLVI